MHCCVHELHGMHHHARAMMSNLPGQGQGQVQGRVQAYITSLERITKVRVRAAWHLQQHLPRLRELAPLVRAPHREGQQAARPQHARSLAQRRTVVRHHEQPVLARDGVEAGVLSSGASRGEGRVYGLTARHMMTFQDKHRPVEPLDRCHERWLGRSSSRTATQGARMVLPAGMTSPATTRR